jgi:UDP-N-acetylmuramoyl-L-alanyl-D-glutamate--2,6-diaminopimelate ligase
MERYGASKAGLFEMPTLRAAVINADDPFGRELIARLQGRLALVTYSLTTSHQPAPAARKGQAAQRHVCATQVSYSTDGIVLTAQAPAGTVEIRSPLLGSFNAANLLAVFASLLALDMPPAEAAMRLGRARPAAGRVERFGGDGTPLVVVDYAHTPDALQQVLTALRHHVRGRLWCVFGCGGDRDRGKRPEMGRIAEQMADVVIVTDDNPRSESSQQIIDDILAGMETKPCVISDRRAAIAEAIAQAAPRDVVLIAGKGHEDYQEVGGERRPYSDRETVRALLGEAA